MPVPRVVRVVIAMTLSAGAVGASAMIGAVPASAAGLPSGCVLGASHLVTCVYTGAGERAVSLPAGVTSVAVTAVGGGGGADWGGAAGGRGAAVSATVDVSGIDTVYVEVGGNGSNGSNGSGAPGGFNGGANGGLWSGAGGGASDVRTIARSVGSTLNSRLLVAGAGGGSGYDSHPGGDAGANAPDENVGDYEVGGRAGTATAGGAGGTGIYAGGAGSFGQGGSAASVGGAGGAGLYGGGGGAAGFDGAGGGGGSSLVPTGGTLGLATSSTTTPSISVTFTALAPDAPTGVTATGGISQATLTWTAGYAFGFTVTGYTATAADSTNSARGGQACTSVTTGCSINGLTGGDSYTFTVVANSSNSSPASAASNAVVPTSVPVIGTQPLSQTALSGTTATFTAAATGYPAPTVAWQKSTDGGTTFTPISGATSTTYTTPILAAADNASRFRAVFTNSAGNATTQAVILTVPAVAVSASTGSGPLASGAAVTAGTILTLDLSGLTPSAPYTVTLHSAPVILGTVTASSTGTATLQFTLPTSIDAGAHSALITDASNVTVAEFDFAVDPAPALPATGATILAPTGVGLLLLVTGIAMLVATVALERRTK